MTTIRYFAAAADAVGHTEEPAKVDETTTLAELREQVLHTHPHARAVLEQCAIFVDNAQATDRQASVASAQSVDFLPPFAGG
ncbi:MULTISPECIES: MoaD/ThiS family protein [Corynebacterium]|uniref:MoaD/ThiS family protein n=1 Tax=Corynebacterium TaxID=1716 RepID=UPI0008A1C19A|nr:MULTISPECIES: MoaD/ThiS family protein [Corynebacterium]MCT1443088.1 MoaD/ThiS family protein [Corynebacterium glucuronolyticum]MCT1564302.1 MoaD/ThiS family protein [Corynebacterium glucuronolyticum]OFO42925.1 molybdopterin synthase sulfur carrier subunit [Corynebacterium sp. HMSC073D01]